MNILTHLVHPAHFHLFKNIVVNLDKKGHETIYTIRNKDVLLDLISAHEKNYITIGIMSEKDKKVNSTSYINRLFKLSNVVRAFKPKVMISSSPEISILGKFFRIPSILFFEDDLEEVKKWALVSGPLASTLICPTSCSAANWEYKAIKYNGYHELAYLHPKYFTPDIKVLSQLNLRENEKFFILRFAKLTAHHDQGKTGITDSIAARIIKKLKDKGKIFITSERELIPEFEQYRIKIDPAEIHSVINYADLYIGDSQTMAAEAAVLGTPSIRFNDFVGKLGYLEELEHKYGLTFGIKTSDPEKLFDKIDELLALPNLKEEWKNKKEKMLSEKIDVTAFMVWFVENYPDSVKVMKDNPEYQYRFK